MNAAWLCEASCMAWSALGDSAWLFEACGADAATRLARVLEFGARLDACRIDAVRDIVSSFETLAVHFDPADGERIMEWLKDVPPPLGNTPSNNERIVEVPVDYSGVGEVADVLGLSEKELIRLHSGADYTVAALGFAPGFPYFTGLPERLRLPRMATPRKVAAGSVAIAGKQAGIYPFDSQGGWHVLGRTDLRLFDPSRAQPTLLKPGDRVKFVPGEISNESGTVPSVLPNVPGGFEVIDPGALTTVQGLGRTGYQNIGVSPGGAADPVAARVANRLVGNNDDAAVLECCMRGPRLRFHQDVRVAWTGWRDSRCGRPADLTSGDELDLRGRMALLRGYIAIAGGIDVPLVLGSRSTDSRAGFGGWQGRGLKAGDKLPVGVAHEGPEPGAWRIGWPETVTDTLELRFLKGLQADWFSQEAHKVFQNAIYHLSPVSDRMGVRLEGPELERERLEEMVSQPVVAGSVQVPPDGRPIVLLADRQTIGGYPQIGHVISADLPKLARAWPGTRLRFREVTLDEARAAWAGLRRDLGMLAAGIELISRSP
jgi:KipI family sensor histidine kinase inhibitor